MQINKIIRIALVTLAILFIFFLISLTTNEMNWDLMDYVVAGLLLFTARLAFEFVSSRSTKMIYKMAAALAIGTALFLMWVNLAVGLIGSEDNPANILYVGVLVVGLLGAFISRFRAGGLARAMVATAIAQVFVPIIALIIWKPELNIGVVQVIGVNALFVMLWLVSALLFERANKIMN